MNKLHTINAEELQNRTYEPTHFLVDELIPEGLHILAGAPKIGKSWLALWLCLCVSQGQPLWNFAVTQGEVLYLSLEDSFQRIQTRLFDLTEDAPPTLHFAIMADTLKHGLEQQIEQFLAEHPNTKLVVIDTLQRVRSAGSDSNLYANDYDATWTDSRKNITYVTPDGRKCRDSKLHIEKYLKENMEAEFGYRTENDNTRNVDAAQKADGRGATAGTQRDGHGAELERAARNAGQAVSAADAVERGSENAPDEAGSTERFDRDAGECRKIRETGWEPEREVFFRLQSTDREYEDCPDRDSERYEETAFGYSTGSAEENSPVRMDLNRGIDLVRDAVRLGRAVEQMTDDAPTRDGTTMPLHIDSKRRKKLRQKKTALGHAEDDHEDWNMEQKM